MWRITSFLENLSRLWDWLPIIWDDVDYDSQSLFKIISFKLKRTGDHILNHGIHADDAGIGAEIACVTTLLDRLYLENYLPDHLEAVYKKHGRPRYGSESIEGATNRTRLVSSWESKPKEELEAAEKDFRSACDDSIKQQVDDMDTVFKLMRNNMHKWWD